MDVRRSSPSRGSPRGPTSARTHRSHGAGTSDTTGGAARTSGSSRSRWVPARSSSRSPWRSRRCASPSTWRVARHSFAIGCAISTASSSRRRPGVRGAAAPGAALPPPARARLEGAGAGRNPVYRARGSYARTAAQASADRLWLAPVRLERLVDPAPSGVARGSPSVPGLRFTLPDCTSPGYGISRGLLESGEQMRGVWVRPRRASTSANRD